MLLEGLPFTVSGRLRAYEMFFGDRDLVVNNYVIRGGYLYHNLG
jgi:hypothetical protein